MIGRWRHQCRHASWLREEYTRVGDKMINPFGSIERNSRVSPFLLLRSNRWDENQHRKGGSRSGRAKFCLLLDDNLLLSEGVFCNVSCIVVMRFLNPCLPDMFFGALQFVDDDMIIILGHFVQLNDCGPMITLTFQNNLHTHCRSKLLINNNPGDPIRSQDIRQTTKKQTKISADEKNHTVNTYDKASKRQISSTA